METLLDALAWFRIPSVICRYYHADVALHFAYFRRKNKNHQGTAITVRLHKISQHISKTGQLRHSWRNATC